MKKILCFILTLCIMMSIFVCPSYAQEVKTEESPVKHGTEVYVKGKIDNSDGKHTGKLINIKFMANEYDADIVPKTTYESLSYKLDETGLVDFKFRCNDITFDKIGQCNRRVYATLDGEDVTSSLESVTAKDLYYIEEPFENNEETKSKIIEKFKEFFDEYSYGRTVYLKSADKVRIKISSETLKFSSSLSVKIREMNDENIKYVRLYAVGENVNIPKVKERKVAVWKLDDLQMSNSAIRGFEKAYNYFSQYGIKAGFGIIMHSFDEYGDLTTEKNKAKIDKINSWIDGGFEIWYHGYWHNKNTDGTGERIENFGSDPLEKQEKNLKMGIDTFKRVFPNYTMKSFGAPYNSVCKTTAQALKNVCPDINTVMFFDDSEVEESGHFNIDNSVSIESKAGDEDFEKFELSFKSKKGRDGIILQSHPWGWDDKDLEIIDKITKVLVAEDYAFMTPQEYYNYCQKRNK